MIRFAILLALLAGCQKKSSDGDQAGSGEADKVDLPPPGPPRRVQHPPPPDVGGIPDDAVRTPGGVPYKPLDKTGTSNERPGRNDTVKVHYTAWKTSGETYFSTRDHDKPQPLQLFNVGPGWAEVLPMMTIGESRRLWLTARRTPRGSVPAPRAS
jgi:hypothetical protein